MDIELALHFFIQEMAYFFHYGDGIHLFSERLYAAAQRYYSSERKSLQPLLSWQGSQVEVQQGPSLITIGQIQKFAKHPIKFFLQHVLGIYLPSLFRKEQKEYILPGYERIRLLKEGLVQPFQNVLAAAKAEGLMPLGAFEKVIEKRMYEENAQTKELLKDLGISSSQIQPLSLMHEGQPLIVEGPSGALYHLQGRLEGVCPRGLIVQGDDSTSDLVTIWPLYLIFLSLVEARPEQGKDLILTKASTTLSLDVERPRLLLGAYLDYFMQSQKSPSFLMPMWAESILTANIKEFTKKMAKKEFLEVAPFPDDYLRWVFLRDPPLTEEVFYSFYERVVPHAFSPLVKHLRES
jgi:exonuclease V gamma subunit